MIKKLRWKCRVLLIKTPNYKHREYLRAKKIYQSHIKNFHKRTIKSISIIKKGKFSIDFIDFDGKKKLCLKKLNYKRLFNFTDQLSLPKHFDKKIKPINLSLFSDYNPKTTTHGLGFKNKEKAIYTLDKIKDQPIKYQKSVVSTMIGRAKNHPHKNKDMEEAIKIFQDWLDKNKSHKD